MAGLDDERAAEIARWLSEGKAEPVRFERVEPGDEEILEDREQRDLDGVPSFLTQRGDENSSGELEAP